VAGNYTAKNIDKIGLLKELSFEFYPAKTMDLLMVAGACMSAECKLVEIIELGDHPLLIGEIENITATDKQPLSYFQGKYHKVGEEIQKPNQDFRDLIKELAQQFSKIDN
jgi:flavin reductase (DIM6/NTAB) family NADH-FMN oxidoreductase RutF